MSVKDELNQKREEQRDSIPAKRLKEKLTPINSRVDEMTKRWFWELLQNASDYNESVKVKLEITDESITFSHNGAPFSVTDALNLIAPDSGKDSDEIEKKDNIGKFGSGLISTHILSSFLTVQGIFLSKEENEYYQFKMDLDRGDYDDKSKLIDSINKSNDQLKENSQPANYESGTFQSHFKYDLNKSFKGVNASDVVEKGVNYLVEVLPFTLCFMNKVNSVELINNSSFNFSFSNYRIDFKDEQNSIKYFNLEIDQKNSVREFFCPSLNDVSSAVELVNHEFTAYPNSLSKLFCGLPLVGTEKVGLPIIINSQKFTPTTERDTLELSPNDVQNKKLMLTGAELYKMVLEYAAQQKMKTAYTVAFIRKNFNGIEASKIWFSGELMTRYKKLFLEAPILMSAEGDFIPLSETRIPKVNEHEEEFHAVASIFNPKKVPAKETFTDWLEAIDFNLFPSIQYKLETFLQDITINTHLTTFALYENAEPIEWLQRVMALVSSVDDNLFNKYNLFLNWNKTLCPKEAIYLAVNLPDALIEINNQLNDEKLGDTLIHEDLKEFSNYLGPNKTRDFEFLTHRIDDALKQKFSDNAGNTATFIEPLRHLFKWYNKTELSKSELKDFFPWFNNKRATLFLETFNETERDQALIIAQSNKMESLANLANSSLTNDELNALAKQAHLIPKLLEMLKGKRDDESTANLETGNAGEEIVYRDLKKRFPDYQGFEVIWSSRDLGEGRFDFEVKKQNDTLYYIDAKTTSTIIQQSDKIPFYVRSAQWQFWQTEQAKNKYLLARVFKSAQPTIKYLEINFENNLNQQ